MRRITTTKTDILQTFSMNLFALITSKLRSLPPKHCAVAVGVLEGAVAVRDDEGHPLDVEQDQVRAQELLQPLLGAELRPAHRHAPQPAAGLRVLRLPGVGGGHHQQPCLGQHRLQRTD